MKFAPDWNTKNAYILFYPRFTLHGNSEISAHVRSNICKLIFLRHLIRSRSVKDWIEILILLLLTDSDKFYTNQQLLLLDELNCDDFYRSHYKIRENSKSGIIQ